jgi:glycosyltransferase involved in cell wall biosynthesis
MTQSPSTSALSILVLTKDEEVNIEECLRCFDFSDDVIVLDSHSKDRTVEIARRFPNVRVFFRKFDTWSEHSNWALENLPFRHPWVYYSDADERVPPALRDELLRQLANPDSTHVAYRLRYKNIFMGRWLRHGGIYPVWIMRLFRPDRVRYETREVNAHPVVDGTVGELREHFIHYSFNKGLLSWFVKHNGYSTMEAREGVRIRSRSSLRKEWAKLFSKDAAERRRSMKNLSFFIPLRGMVRFLHMYLWRGGFLDGRAGYHYCAMIAMYEYWIELKIRELEHPWQEKTTRTARRLLQEAR